MLLTKAELALGKLASKDATRYSMNSIAVTSDETQVTNGHYLVRVKHSEQDKLNWPMAKVPIEFACPNGKPILINGDVAAKASNALPKKSTIPVLQLAALTADSTLHVNPLDGAQAFDAKGEGTFPDLNAVMPKGEPKVRIGLDAKYVRLLADYFEKYGDARNATIELSVYDAESAVMLKGKTDAGEEIVAVLMPRRL